MMAAERFRSILERLDQNGAVQVGPLAKTFGVSEETIRRDLARLEREGRLQRTHGGAMPKDGGEDLPYPLRHGTARMAKMAIARRAAMEIRDGMTVMVDSSSTAYSVLPELSGKADLTIVTNSVPICADSSITRHTILSTGGELRRKAMTFSGPLAVSALARFKADLALIGVKALCLETGLMEASVADAEMKLAFLANARRTVLLADSRKFGAEGTVAAGHLSQIDALVTEIPPPAAWLRVCEAEGVDLLLPETARNS